MSPQVTARAPTPNFPTPGLDYDRENESQFRLAVEQFMVEVARFPTETSGLASHGLDFHDDVTVSSASQDDFLKHDGSEFVNVQHDRSLHDGLGTGTVVYTQESQTLTNKTLSTGSTVQGANDIPGTIAQMLNDHNRSAHDGLGTGVILYAGETWTQTADATFSGDVIIGTDPGGTKALRVGGDILANTLESDVATGTAPLVVASTTVVTNLNADRLDGSHKSFYRDVDNMNAGTLSVTRGGTGVSDPTSGNVLVGAGSSAMTELAPGADGGYVRSNGSSWVRGTIQAGDIPSTFIETTDSPTWTGGRHVFQFTGPQIELREDTDDCGDVTIDYDKASDRLIFTITPAGTAPCSAPTSFIMDAPDGLSWGGGSAIASSDNVADLTANETVTGAWTFDESILVRSDPGLHIQANVATLLVEEVDAAVDEKMWDLVTVNGELRLRTLTDGDAFGENIMKVQRTGTSVDFVIFPQGPFKVGDGTDSGELRIRHGAQGVDYRFETDENPGLVLRVDSSPVAGGNIFSIESSGGSKRLLVEHDGVLATTNDTFVLSGTASGAGAFSIDKPGNTNLLHNGSIYVRFRNSDVRFDVDVVLNGSNLNVGGEIRGDDLRLDTAFSGACGFTEDTWDRYITISDNGTDRYVPVMDSAPICS